MALFAGLVTGNWWFWLIAAGLIYSSWLLYQTRMFYLWLENDDGTYPPDAGGIWGDIFDTIYRVQEKHRHSLHKLEDQLTIFERLITALPDGIVLINPEGKIRWWNLVSENLLGLKPEYDLGRPIQNLIRDPAFIRHLQQPKEEGLILPAPNNPHQFVLITIIKLKTRETMLLMRDITRLRQLEEMRKDFVANVSHELRTPLTVIIGYLEPIIEDLETAPGTLQLPLEKTLNHARNMSEIIEDLSTLSKLDEETAHHEPAPVDLHELIRRIVADADMIEPGANINIELNLNSNDIVIKGSETELASCFTNLITNAIKYRKGDSSNIKIESGFKSGNAYVSISDDGCGIDPRHIPRLTERFYRVDDSRSRKTGGTGLGLAIVKHILLRHTAASMPAAHLPVCFLLQKTQNRIAEFYAQV
jgi:two-component system phosphate regulon sensor histidine kinase PhoR